MNEPPSPAHRTGSRNWRAVLALTAGLCWTAAFPKFDLAGLAWLTPALLLATTHGLPPRRAFGFGYLAGFVHNLSALYWLCFIPFPAGAVVGWLALSAYLALFPAVWTWSCARLLAAGAWRTRRDADPARPRPWPTAAPAPSHAPAPPKDNPDAPLRWPWLDVVVTQPWSARTLWALSCAILWVALELVRGRFLTGFPWNLLGASQYELTPLIQIASLTGTAGVSFLVVWGSVALYLAAFRLLDRLRQPPRALWRSAPPRPSATGAFASARVGGAGVRWGLFADLAAPFVVLIAAVFWGGAQLVRPTPVPRELAVALIQPSIPQRLIFDPHETTNRFATLMRLSELALATRPDLLVWPEASLPGVSEDHYQALTNLIARHRVAMVLGADDAEALDHPGQPETYAYFNAAFLLGPDGTYRTHYRKRHLVMFGEYLPLADTLPFLRRLLPIPTDFTPGDRPGRFDLADPPARLAPLICFEDIFGDAGRDATATGADVLLNLTNNGWFGESAAQWQHAAAAVFRCVENGLPLVRCTNNGLTCWVDARGRLRAVHRTSPTDIYGPGFLTVRIPLGPALPTFYGRHGDWFGWGCTGWGALLLTATFLPRRHARA